MIIVTGAAGFIGSCIVARLNQEGEHDLILVDHMPDDRKKGNLEGKKYSAYFDKKDFLKKVLADDIQPGVTAVIHMGACSSTTLQDEAYFTENNLEYTQALARWCMNHDVRFIYASSAATYGDGGRGYKDDDATVRQCRPLNLYGESKQKFDLWALENGYLDRMAGLKFFNVFGPNEYHKGDMRSVVAKAYRRVAEEGVIELFKSYQPDFADGEQKRDFIYVKDAVDIVLFFLLHPEVNGIYNVGTGHARSWNDLAKALFLAVGRAPDVRYIEMPEVLRKRYQYFTEADMSKLRAAGYNRDMTPLEDAVADYARYLKNESHL